MKLSGWIFMILSWEGFGVWQFLLYEDIQKGPWRRRQRKDIEAVKEIGEMLRGQGISLKDWPVYVLLGAVAFFFIFVVVKGNLQDRKSKHEQNKEKDIR